MTVSIAIPCRNHARFLGDAIESALAQTWPDTEVIVVDDGSTDGSAAVAAQYGAVRLLKQPRRGVSCARNAGLHASRGALLIFLDADDRLTPEAARTAAGLLGRRPEVMLATGRCRVIDEHGTPTGIASAAVHGPAYPELLRRNYIWMPGMAAFRREAFAVVGGFDPERGASADYDIYLRVARRFAVASHEAIVAEYRRHGANMSGDPVLMFDATRAVLRAQRPFVHGDGPLEEAWREGLRHWRSFYGEQLVDRFRSALHARRWSAAARDAAHLVRIYPRGVRVHLWRKLRREALRPLSRPLHHTSG